MRSGRCQTGDEKTVLPGPCSISLPHCYGLKENETVHVMPQS